MSRRIIFAGGMQTRAVARLYRGAVADDTGDDVVFIGSGAIGTEAARSALLLADVVVTEIDEDGDAVPSSDLPTQATLIRIPNLYADYLWPFAGRSHPRNRGPFVLPGGPYPAEHGDRFLDQMAEEGVDEDEAVRRYLAMDIVKEGELDSRLEDRLNIQRRLDGVGGFDLTDFIADNFRARQLFRTRQRVTQKLLRRLMRQMLPKLGIRGFSLDRLTQVPFPAGAQPVHPGVAAHFGLRWVGPNQRYPMNEEGYFTFEQFCRRYMRFTWNEPLHRGIQTAKTQPEAALAHLEQGLAVSPESPLGRRARLIVRHVRGLDSAAPANMALDEESYDPAMEGPPAGAAARGRAAQTAAPEEGTPDVAAAGLPEPEAAAPATEAVETAPDPSPAGEETSPETAPEAADDAPAPEAEPDRAAADDDAPEASRTRLAAPARPADPDAPSTRLGTTHDGFTDFGPPGSTREKSQQAAPAPAKMPAAAQAEQGTDGFTDFGKSKPGKEKPAETALANVNAELIEALPRLLPVFTDLSSAADRPFASMPEIMPPPPLRPILPPELQNEPARPGLFSRILGRKSGQ